MSKNKIVRVLSSWVLVVGALTVAACVTVPVAEKKTNEAREQFSSTCLKKGLAAGTPEHEECIITSYKAAQEREKQTRDTLTPPPPPKPAGTQNSDEYPY